MGNSITGRSQGESLQMENEFLKMKLMLEKGAVFGSFAPGMLSPEMEHTFLQRIMEMEAQFEQAGRVTIYERLGRPVQFKPVDQVPAQAIHQAWDQLYGCLRAHGIELVVSSPYISDWELYRFVTEEFFAVETEACDPPGVISVYHYDSFHPDPFFECTETALRSCMEEILGNPVDRSYSCMRRSDIQLNNTKGLRLAAYIKRVEDFRSAFDRMEICELEDTDCRVMERESIVRGRYAITCYSGKEAFHYEGKWTITLVPDQERYFWYVYKVMIEGLPV